MSREKGVGRFWDEAGTGYLSSRSNKVCVGTVDMAASILFPPTKNGIKSQLPPLPPPLFVLPPQRNEKNNFPPLFIPPPHLDFEVNFPPGASQHISTLKMSQMVELLLSDLVLIVN